eukprot:337615_1
MYNMFNLNTDEKLSDTLSDSESDCDEETIVHNTDLRKKIIQSVDKDHYIIRCIGELIMDYKYSKHGFELSMCGTATVFHVLASLSTPKAYALTCAHNMRQEVIECIKCKKYLRKKRKINNTYVTTSTCSACGGSKFNKIMLKATSIVFTRREIKPSTSITDDDGENVIFHYGNPKCTYECDSEFVPDFNYSLCPKPKSGYDIAIISFDITDKYNYAKYSKQITFQNMTDALQKKAVNKFRIYGYPGDNTNKKGKMHGMHSTHTEYVIKTHSKTNQPYLVQQEIDTSPGQSGCAVWTQDTKSKNDKMSAVIFAVHVGGNGKKKFGYNVATLIDDDILYKIKQVYEYNVVEGADNSSNLTFSIKFIGANSIDIKSKFRNKNHKSLSAVVQLKVNHNNEKNNANFMFCDKEVKHGSEITGLKECHSYLVRMKGEFVNTQNQQKLTSYSSIQSFTTLRECEEVLKVLNDLMSDGNRLHAAMAKISIRKNKKQKDPLPLQHELNKVDYLLEILQNADEAKEAINVTYSPKIMNNVAGDKVFLMMAIDSAKNRNDANEVIEYLTSNDIQMPKQLERSEKLLNFLEQNDVW